MAKFKVALAFQGGGAHGAFTWGVMDRLLEEEIEIAGISGTSAGAMNAAIVAHGLQIGGREGARELLHKFWYKISEAGKKGILQPTPLDDVLHPGEMDYSPGFNWFNLMTLMFSPYELNPLNINPLKDILEELIDFEKLRNCDKTRLFVCATNVYNCRVKVFHLPEITVDALLASACLPFLFQSVVIDGIPYWDGGYMGNPPIFPLIEETDTKDILLVKINPVVSEKIPKTAREIEDRLNEISFNSSLMWEMRWINFKNKLVRQGFDEDGRLREIYIHTISADEALAHLGYSSKLNTTWKFLMTLRTIGRTYAEKWLNESLPYVGKQSSCDIYKSFL
jgi:NTE family protein